MPSDGQELSSLQMGHSGAVATPLKYMTVVVFSCSVSLSLCALLCLSLSVLCSLSLSVYLSVCFSVSVCFECDHFVFATCLNLTLGFPPG